MAEVIDNTTSRGAPAVFIRRAVREFKEQLFQVGQTPIPEYLNGPEPEDLERYQNIFAQNEGAVVAPAAGCILVGN